MGKRSGGIATAEVVAAADSAATGGEQEYVVFVIWVCSSAEREPTGR